MKAITPWITYRTRFLVKAKQLTSSLTFTDALGRQHSGRKGDYLVESSDGVLRVAPRQIFEDIYVPLLASEISQPLDSAIFLENSLENSAQQESSHYQDSTNIPLPSRKRPQSERNRRDQIHGFRSL
ncbi:MAG: hypothetical protein WBV55_23020 [Candidatus Sulfotelmatobacter sp.]